MTPLSTIWAPNHGGPTVHVPAEDLQLRIHVSRESEATATPTLDSGTSSTPTLPPSASHHSPRQLNDDALGDFFGGRGHRTRTQRREHRAPPPYSSDWDGEKLPVYSTSPDFETETVARHLFKYGFRTFTFLFLRRSFCSPSRLFFFFFDSLVFPVFWAIGVYFLFAPMRVPDDWQSDKTDEEKEKILSEIKETEAKWAKRCLWALLSFLVCLCILIVALVVSKR